MYRNFDTNELWSLEEIKEIFDGERELQEQFESFEDYIEHLLDLGKSRAGGIVEANWYAVQATTEDAWDMGSYDWDEAVEIANERGEDIIAEIQDDICIAEYHRGEDF